MQSRWLSMRERRREKAVIPNMEPVCCGKEKIQWAEPVVIVSRASLILSTRAVL